MKHPDISLPVSDVAFLKKLIPHREPMVLIDTLHYYDKNIVETKLTIIKGSLFVKNNLISESGILEHMAQSVALNTGYSGYLNGQPIREGYIGAIKNAEIFQLPKVGDTVTTQVKINYTAMDMTLVAIESKVEGNVIATAQMSTILKPIKA